MLSCLVCPVEPPVLVGSASPDHPPYLRTEDCYQHTVKEPFIWDIQHGLLFKAQEEAKLHKDTKPGSNKKKKHETSSINYLITWHSPKRFHLHAVYVDYHMRTKKIISILSLSNYHYPLIISILDLMHNCRSVCYVYRVLIHLTSINKWNCSFHQCTFQAGNRVEISEPAERLRTWDAVKGAGLFRGIG